MNFFKWHREISPKEEEEGLLLRLEEER